MITSNVLTRVFRIRLGEAVGSCFTLDVGGRQYVVTARHLFRGQPETPALKIYHEDTWRDAEYDLVGHAPGGADVSVIALYFQLSPDFPMHVPGEQGAILGQDVYFLGFPFGLSEDPGELNRHFPLPFVKKAIVSYMKRAKNGVVGTYYLDGNNNPGFSGGPVVFRLPEEREFKVLGVVSGDIAVLRPVYSQEDGALLPMQHEVNTGIIVAHSIKYALDVIHDNPIGYRLAGVGE